MKKGFKVTIILLVLSLVMSIAAVPAVSNAEEKPELRGVWVASVVNIDYPSKATVDAESLKSEAIRILDNAQAMKMNAVFLQVRPASDALYQSKYFPWSKYLTGVQGLAPQGGFDPLKFWVEEAHKRGIELHAWVNPYRVTKKTAAEPIQSLDTLYPFNPAVLHSDWVVKYMDDLYYDPGLPEVRQLVIDGVLEIVENYDVDGIHFDDYFYPGKGFNDAATYKKYGAGFNNIDDWRRENVNILIKDLSKAIKDTGKSVRFGVSPFGIWANKSTAPLGSDTKGNQSYFSQYADTRKWVKEGWLDYIAPQIYWNIGYSIADYSKIVDWWEDTVAGTKVDLYIGQAAYKAGNSNPTSPWHGVAEIEKQLKLNQGSSGVKGSIFFSYKSFLNNPALSAAVKAIHEQEDGITAKIPVTVARPWGNTTTSYTQYYITGASDPGKPLYLNGKLVANRSSQGFFGVLVPLANGANAFTFSQEGSFATRVIYKQAAAAAAPVKLKDADIVAGSAYPQSQIYRMPGEVITLSCKAPAGSKLTVQIGGQSFEMKSSGAAANPAALYADTYKYDYTIPAFSGAPRNVDLGEPIYTMDYNGIVKTLKSPAKVTAIMKGSPFYARVEKAVAYTYQTPSSSNGASYELYRGMVDYVTGMNGSYIRLSSGQWISKSDVMTYEEKTAIQPAVKSVSYTAGEKWDSMSFDMTSPAAAIASFDGKELKLDISLASTDMLPILPQNSLFSSTRVEKGDARTRYILTAKESQRIEGYYIEMSPTGFTLNIKRPVKAAAGDKPLTGIVIMVDPGHGGSDSGATGPWGWRYLEKAINLNSAIKLRAELEGLGATVLMTRTGDTAVTLDERLTASRNVKPDLFVSIHANSMSDNVDISKVEGFSAFYREELSKPIAQAIFNEVITDLGRGSKGLHDKNFYVIRGTWAPSVLFESGFVPNPNEFEWLINSNEQTKLAKSVSEAIVKYFQQ